jgi:hypothetical protein
VDGGRGEDKGTMANCVNAGNSDTAAETGDNPVELKFAEEEILNPIR